MNNDLISRSALLADIQDAVDNGGMGGVVAGALKRYIKRAPAVEAVPVRTGQWIEHYNESFDIWNYDCPFCDDGYATKGRDITPPNFCGNCGAYLAKEAVKNETEQNMAHNGT